MREVASTGELREPASESQLFEGIFRGESSSFHDVLIGDKLRE